MQGWANILYKRTFCYLRYFIFFIKERSVLCILLHYLEKNVPFFVFFYILYKRMLHSLRAITFFLNNTAFFAFFLDS